MKPRLLIFSEVIHCVFHLTATIWPNTGPVVITFSHVCVVVVGEICRKASGVKYVHYSMNTVVIRKHQQCQRNIMICRSNIPNSPFSWYVSFWFWRYLTRRFIQHWSQSSIRSPSSLIRLWNHAQISSWNQTILSDEGNVSWSWVQRGAVMGFESTTERLRVTSTSQFATPPQQRKVIYIYMYIETCILLWRA